MHSRLQQYVAVLFVLLVGSTPIGAQDQVPCADPCEGGDQGSCTTTRGATHTDTWLERRTYTPNNPMDPPRIETRQCRTVYTPLSVICIRDGEIISNWVGFHQATSCDAWA